jgi:hypothetical protein
VITIVQGFVRYIGICGVLHLGAMGLVHVMATEYGLNSGAKRIDVTEEFPSSRCFSLA